jgi:hypothetical protein
MFHENSVTQRQLYDFIKTFVLSDFKIQSFSVSESDNTVLFKVLNRVQSCILQFKLFSVLEALLKTQFSPVK